MKQGKPGVHFKWVVLLFLSSQKFTLECSIIHKHLDLFLMVNVQILFIATNVINFDNFLNK